MAETVGGIRVLVIGGTSLVGKSTLARRLAVELGWEHWSTDQLARHPGRPWRDYGSAVPADVSEHYANLTADELTEAVLDHYRDNVWPIAEALVHCRINNPYDTQLILEGSALLPDLAAAAGFENVAAVWITASDDLLTQRIHRMSRHPHKAPPERELIDAFLDRAIGLDSYIRETAEEHDQQTVDAEAPDLFEQLRALPGARGLR